MEHDIMDLFVEEANKNFVERRGIDELRDSEDKTNQIVKELATKNSVPQKPVEENVNIKRAIEATQVVPEKTAPEVVRQATSNEMKEILRSPDFKNTPENIKNHYSDNNEKLAQDIEKRNIDRQENPNKEPGIADQFLDAISFFLPTAVGGLLGTALGGVEAGVAGAEAGGKLSAAYRQSALDREKLELQKQKAGGRRQSRVDVTPGLVDKITGEIRTTRVNADTGLPEVIDLKTGKVIDPSTVENKEERLNRINQEQINKRASLNLNDREIGRIETTLKGFGKRTDVAKITGSLDSTDEILSMVNSGVPITEDFISTWIAKGIQGQIGVLTDNDITRAGIPLDIGRKFKSSFKEFVLGDMTDDKKKTLNVLLNVSRKRAVERLEKKIDGFASKTRSKRLKYSIEDIKKDLKSELLIYDEEPASQEKATKIPGGKEIVQRNGKTYKWNPNKKKFQLVK